MLSGAQKNTHHDEIIIALEGELVEARVLLQSSLENTETVNEEMQSTNEELMASNEELQSTNEELQSVNEELNIVNLERSKKIDEVIQAKDDIDNLIRSAKICTIILNSQLEIRVFTPEIKKIFNLMGHDIGRPLENFQHNLKFDLLLSKASEVLKTKNIYESEIVSNDNHWYLLKIIPYLPTQTQDATGVVISFIDINQTKLLQEEKSDIENDLRAALKSGLIGIWHYNLTDNSFTCDDTIKKIYGLHSVTSMKQLSSFIAATHPDDRKQIEEALEATIKKNEDFEQNFRIIRTDGSVRYLSCSTNIHISSVGPIYLTGITWDITEKYWLEEKIIDAKHLNLGLDAITDGWWDWDLNTNKTYLSPLLKKTLGYEDHELANRMEAFEQLIVPKDLQALKIKMASYITNSNEHPWIQELRFKHKSGQIIWLLSRRKGILDRQKKIVRMIGTITDISVLKENEHSLEKLAYLDFLTQVPNKPAFSDALLRAIARNQRTKTSFAVLYLDIDNFKDINDKWGHNFGDAVICEVANKLNNCSRVVDLLARLAGDEFAVLLEDISKKQDILDIAKRYLSPFSEPSVIDHKLVPVTISIGIALYPEHGTTAQEILQHADQAMYLAKKQGKNRIVL